MLCLMTSTAYKLVLQIGYFLRQHFKIFIEKLKSNLLFSAPYKHLSWLRYIEDI